MASTSRLKTGLLLIAASLLSTVHSEQLRFEREGQQYSYQWRDGQRSLQSLSFSLGDYPRELTRSQAYRHEHWQQYLMDALRAWLAQQAPEQQLQFTLSDASLSYSLRGPAMDAQEKQTLLAELRLQQSSVRQAYFQQYHYQWLQLHGGISGITPSHQQLAELSSPHLQALADATLGEGENALEMRQHIALMLSFVQAIPYNQLQSADGKRGKGYQTPIQVIRNNQGDCDSKSTLLAAVIRQAYPRIAVAMVYLNDHALLAVDIGPEAGDETIDVSGRPMVLIEPTGPAQLPIGRVGSGSRQKIGSGQYTTVLLDWPVIRQGEP
ncbi:hypothetical protein [Aliagarivorans marinus]|uniref:hypothetical protein n=1 Tax=Aliagarivorans marinus TaxID=561965 RepID=UPI000429144A|nr:hypothetical protein [Aliagarivorans marinus]